MWKKIGFSRVQGARVRSIFLRARPLLSLQSEGTRSRCTLGSQLQLASHRATYLQEVRMLAGPRGRFTGGLGPALTRGMVAPCITVESSLCHSTLVP